MLPLSNNLDLGKDMGTRHRACLGIAENSDAIAVVVSEETGIISMAKNGVLIRHFDRQTCTTRLVDEMIPRRPPSERQRRRLARQGQEPAELDEPERGGMSSSEQQSYQRHKACHPAHQEHSERRRIRLLLAIVII